MPTETEAAARNGAPSDRAPARSRAPARRGRRRPRAIERRARSAPAARVEQISIARAGPLVSAATRSRSRASAPAGARQYWRSRWLAAAVQRAIALAPSARTWLRRQCAAQPSASGTDCSMDLRVGAQCPRQALGSRMVEPLPRQREQLVGVGQRARSRRAIRRAALPGAQPARPARAAPSSRVGASVRRAPAPPFRRPPSASAHAGRRQNRSA